jgi:hypothetical protein
MLEADGCVCVRACEQDEPLAGYPLMKLWADSKDCGAAMESLMKNKYDVSRMRAECIDMLTYLPM